MFQDIVYCRYGNKDIMISKNIVVAIAPLAPYSTADDSAEGTADAALRGSQSTLGLNLLFSFLSEI